MKKHLNIKYFIATDKYNLLRDEENHLKYFIKKIYYRLYLQAINQYEPIIINKKGIK